VDLSGIVGSRYGAFRPGTLLLFSCIFRAVPLSNTAESVGNDGKEPQFLSFSGDFLKLEVLDGVSYVTFEE
jgi:hypothetical protein